jgi:histidinol-phosphate aminotransferase
LLRTQQTVWEGLSYLQRELERLRINYLPTHTNFFLIEVPVDAKTVYEAMLRQGVIVRAMNAYGLPRYIRINVGLPAENERFIQTFRQVLAALEDSGSTKAVM